MFQLDIRSRIPMYEQLVEKMKELIMHEVFKPEEQMPSVRVLAQELTMNPNTIQKAYRELEHQGYIYSIPGKGKYVSPKIPILHQVKEQAMKAEILKIISEALYLGISKKDILDLIEQAERSVHK